VCRVALLGIILVLIVIAYFPFAWSPPRTLSSTRLIPTACALPSADRFRSITLRLQTVSEDWAAVMCNLCQYARAVGET
jgi:hypothetical protein